MTFANRAQYGIAGPILQFRQLLVVTHSLELTMHPLRIIRWATDLVKQFAVSVVVALAICTLCYPMHRHSTAQEPEPASVVNEEDVPQVDGFAVLELFTSQGCSSCPAADRLLAEIHQQAHDQHQQVFCLSFHVDYWNDLGWNDPYSKTAFSRRQREYVKANGGEGVYTPQLIVNGKYGFTGSNKELAEKAIETATKETKDQKRPSIKVTADSANAEEATESILTIAFDVKHADSTDVISLALVERSAGNVVPRGENSGRELKHVNVVRAFDSVSLKKSARGTVEIKLPADLAASDCQLIAYVQDSETFHIRTVALAEISVSAQ